MERNSRHIHSSPSLDLRHFPPPSKSFLLCFRCTSLFSPCFHQRDLLRFLLQSPFSHDHSSLVTPIQMTHMPPLDDFQCFPDDLFMFLTSVAHIALFLYFTILSCLHVPFLSIHFPRTPIEYNFYYPVSLVANYCAICHNDVATYLVYIAKVVYVVFFSFHILGSPLP